MDFSIPQDMQDPNIIWNTAGTDAATPGTIKHPLEMVPSLSHFTRTLAALMVRRSGVLHAPAARLVEEQLGRPAQLMKDHASKGKPTGMALRVPSIDVSAFDPTAEFTKQSLEESRAEANRRSET